MKRSFTEEQKFTRWWLWIILIGIGVLPIFPVFKQVSNEVEVVSENSFGFAFIIFSVIIYGLIALFLVVKLKTEINQNEIRMSFFPFVKKQVGWSEIKTAEVVNYGFVGGWGIRLGTAYGTVYNIKGNKGLAIELTNGKKFLIGTQKETEMKKMVEEIRSQNS